jgi:hypothetical protein
MNSIRARTGVDSFRSRGVLKDQRSLPPSLGAVPEVFKERKENRVWVRETVSRRLDYVPEILRFKLPNVARKQRFTRAIRTRCAHWVRICPGSFILMLRTGTSVPQSENTAFLSVHTSISHVVVVRNCGLFVSREAMLLASTRAINCRAFLISEEGDLWNGGFSSLWDVVNCSVVWLETIISEGHESVETTKTDLGGGVHCGWGEWVRVRERDAQFARGYIRWSPRPCSGFVRNMATSQQGTTPWTHDCACIGRGYAQQYVESFPFRKVDARLSWPIRCKVASPNYHNSS